MKLKFETFFRGFIKIPVVILSSGFWSSVQETKTTSVIARVEKPGYPTETIIGLPNLLERKDALLTFELNRVKILQKNSIGNQPRWQYLASSNAEPKDPAVSKNA